MNSKSKNRINNLALVFAAGVFTTAQVGCQSPANPMLTKVSQLMPRGNTYSAPQTTTDLPVSNHVHSGRTQTTMLSGLDFAANGLVEPKPTSLIPTPKMVSVYDHGETIEELPFESDPDSSEVTDSDMEPDVVLFGDVAQVSLEASSADPNEPPTSGEELFRNDRAKSGILAAEQARPNLDAQLDNRSQSTGWEDSFTKARELERKNDLKGAAAIYEALVGQGFKKPEIFHRLAVCYDQTKRAQLSLPLYEQALDLDPKNPEILCDLGFRLHLVGNVQAAERFYNLALKCDPKHSRANNHLGVLMAQNNRKDEAYAYFRAGGLNMWQAKGNVSAAVHNQELGVDSHQ